MFQNWLLKHSIRYSGIPLTFYNGWDCLWRTVGSVVRRSQPCLFVNRLDTREETASTKL